MDAIRQLFRFGVMVVLSAGAVGCCIVPPFGWGHGQHGNGAYFQRGTLTDHSRGATN